MTADYMQSREVQRRRGGVRRLLLPLLIALIVLIVLLFGVAWIPLMHGRDAWLRGRDAEAIATGEKWSQLHLWTAQYHQLLAASYLTAGNAAAAQPHLGGIGNIRISIIPKDEVARRLFAIQHYGDFLAYDSASHDARESADVALYRAAALAAMNRNSEAQKAFASIDRAHVNASRYVSLQRNLAARATGDAPYVFDRNGGTIAVVRANEVVATNDDFAPLISREAGNLTIGAKLPTLGANASIETTLDPFVQRAALKALTGFRGSLVAIDPRTNEILAIASSRG
jgi:hypothetical protein